MQWIVLAAAGLCACADPRPAFVCTGNDSCRDGDAIGVCEESGFCSFEDIDCTVGRRYGAAAGSNANECVDPGPDPVGSWKKDRALPVGRHTHATVTDGQRLLVLGGISGSTPHPDIWVGDVASGGVSAWSMTTDMPDTRRTHGAAFHDGFVYVIGGRAVLDFSAEVFSAPVDGSGAVGAWSPTNPMPGALRCHAVVQSGDKVYVVGGKTSNTNVVADVVVGTMANGTIDWRPAGTMAAARFCHSATIANGFLYAIGGCAKGKCDDQLAGVEYAKIGADGSLGPFVAGPPLPAGRWHHASAGNDHHLVVLGGDSDTPDTLEVLATHINPDGSLGPWRRTMPLASGGDRKTATVVGEFIYVIAGETQIAPIF